MRVACGGGRRGGRDERHSLSPLRIPFSENDLSRRTLSLGAGLSVQQAICNDATKRRIYASNAQVALISSLPSQNEAPDRPIFGRRFRCAKNDTGRPSANYRPLVPPRACVVRAPVFSCFHEPWLAPSMRVQVQSMSPKVLGCALFRTYFRAKCAKARKAATRVRTSFAHARTSTSSSAIQNNGTAPAQLRRPWMQKSFRKYSERLVDRI